VFDFNTLIPMPEHIQNSEAAWFTWSVENWGTKWNSHFAKYSTKEPECVLCFGTAWTPPEPVFKSLAKQFPAHKIVIHSDEYEHDSHEIYTLDAGQVTCTEDPGDCFDGSTERSAGCHEGWVQLGLPD
jgi:hypothetical protein